MFRTTSKPLDDDHLLAEYHIFGICGTSEVNINSVLGMHALHHRGQEVARFVTCNRRHLHASRNIDIRGVNLNAESTKTLELHGHLAIGHSRYLTSGKANALTAIQPFSSELAFGGFALTHNWNLTNTARRRSLLVQTSNSCKSSADAKKIAHLAAHSHQDTATYGFIDTINQIERVNTPRFISIDGFYLATGGSAQNSNNRGICHICLIGDYLMRLFYGLFGKHVLNGNSR